MSDLLFPGDWLIDTKEHALLKYVDGRLVDRRPISRDFWIYPEDAGFE